MEKILVVIDAGHYGVTYNQGFHPDYFESKQMWMMSYYLRKYLTWYGFKVKITRSKYTNPSLASRGALACRTKGYDEVVFISNHSNASDDLNIRGSEIFISKFLPESKELGEMIVDTISKTMNTKNRGVKTRVNPKNDMDYYGVIKASVGNNKVDQCHYSYLIEYGFHTNEFDCNFLNSNSNLKKLARNVARVLKKYFNK